jgi:mono/diheme cytochrome c family protein
MKFLKMMLVVCSTAVLFAACASGPESDAPAPKKSTPTPQRTQATGTPPMPTPHLGGNSGIGFVPTPSPNQAKPASAASGVNATELYTAQGCVQCHGADGKGIMPIAPNFTDKAWQSKRSDSQLTETIKTGKTPMPGYGSKLGGDQVAALVGYVRAFGK